MTNSIYFSLFISCIFHFIFPQLISILISYGISSEIASGILSTAMFCSAIILPFSGRMIDKGRPGIPLAGGVTLITVGLLGFSQSGLYQEKEIQFAWLAPITFGFILGTSIVYSATRRICEGLASKQKLAHAISLVYLVENAGMGISAVIAYFFIEKYKDLLLIFDGITTVILGALVYFVGKKIGKSESGQPNAAGKFQLKRAIASVLLSDIPMILGIVGAYSLAFLHLSVIQVYYSHHLTSSQKAISMMFGINTVVVVLWTLMVGSKLNFSRMTSTQLKGLFAVGLILLWIGYMGAVLDFGLSIIGLGHVVWSIGEAILLPLASFLIITKYSDLGPGVAVGLRDAIVRVSLVITPLFVFVLKSDRLTPLVILITGLLLLPLSYILRRKSLSPDVLL